MPFEFFKDNCINIRGDNGVVEYPFVFNLRAITATLGVPSYIDVILSGVSPLTLTSSLADGLNYLKLFGGTEQDGTPTPDTPVDIVCNNGVVKWDSVNQAIYTDGTTETVGVKDSNNTVLGTATAQDLYAVGTYKDVQSVLDGAVTRNVGVKVLDGTESWNYYSVTQGVLFRTSISDSESSSKDALGVLCNCFGITNSSSRTSGTLSGSAQNYDFIYDACDTVDKWKKWLSDQYAAGTPVIVVYPLATPTTESVTAQTLTTQSGTNIVEITQASMDGLTMEVSYKQEA